MAAAGRVRRSLLNVPTMASVFTDHSRRTAAALNAASPFNGSTLILLNFTSSTPCWFDLRPGMDAGHGANSGAFSVLDGDRGHITVGLGQTGLPSSTSSASSLETGAVTTTSQLATSSASAQPVQNSGGDGLGAGASAGIGIGVGVAVIAVAGIIAGWVWWKKRKRQASAGNIHSEYYSDLAVIDPRRTAAFGSNQPWQPMNQQQKYYYGGTPLDGPQELSWVNTPAEIGSSATPSATPSTGGPESYELHS